MIINLEQNLEGFDRYNGGWVKTITKLDKDYNNGYSLNGEFIANKRVKNVNLEPNILYLDCSIGGSRKNQEKNYHLFKLVENEIAIIQTIEDGGPDWAVQLWDNVEKELGLQKTKPELVLEQATSLDTDEFIDFSEKLLEDNRFKLYLIKLCSEKGIEQEIVTKLLLGRDD